MVWDDLSASPPPPPRVVIIGGGLAGLAAAMRLVGRDLDVTLLESRPRLGGRAGSFPDPRTGALLDNCQHVAMNCCANFRDFCRRLGVDHQFRQVDALRFVDLQGKVSVLRAARYLPAPGHFLPSLVQLKFLSLADKLRLAQALWAILRWSPPAPWQCDRPDAPLSQTRSVADWLALHGQTQALRTWFWEPVLISALNEKLENLEIAYARQVIVQGFLSHRSAYALQVPRAPLGALFDQPAQDWLRHRGVKVRLNASVRSIDCDDERAVAGVTLRDWSVLNADFVILAVPFPRVKELLDETAARYLPQALAQIDQLRPSPIVGIHWILDQPICPYDHVITPGRLVQWVFNHSQLSETGSETEAGTETFPGVGAGPVQHLQCVISAAGELASWDNAKIQEAVWEELATLWPVARQARVLQARVVREHHATFAPVPGIDALRPRQRTPVDGLMFAGDWTDTGWPATMESAVRSGYQAAEEVLADLGCPQSLLAKPLPTAWLVRGFVPR